MNRVMPTAASGYSVPSEWRFVMADAYRLAFTPPHACLRQPSTGSGFTHTERHLQCIWFDHGLRPGGLQTRDGEAVSVISPGRWNLEAGPDFLDAVLRIDGADARQLCGDIEIHIQPADWERHKHAGDPRYQRVIAHVTYRPSPTPPRQLPPGTVEIFLQGPLAARPTFSMDAVDLTAYPYAAADGGSPCAGILADWQPESVMAVLEAAGAFRIEQKANRFATLCRHMAAETVLYRETMAALGYKQNSAPFRLLAERIPPDELASMTPLDAYALLLGVSGLLPESPSPRWPTETRAFLRLVWDAWWPLQSRWKARQLPVQAWTLSSLRPQNHPVRRLAAAATLFAGPQPPLLDRIRTPQMPVAGPHNAAALFEPAPPLDHWRFHLGLATARRSTPVALMGKARCSAWYINAVVPVLAAAGHDISALLPALPPEQSNSVIRQAARRLLGRDHNPSLYASSGLRQQGLMQIFHDFCLAERTGCAACTFPEFLRTR